MGVFLITTVRNTWLMKMVYENFIFELLFSELIFFICCEISSTSKLYAFA